MDESAEQLQLELLDSVRHSLQRGRPLLTHLNADTTWLLSVPIPVSNNDKDNNSNRRRHKRRKSAEVEVEYLENNHVFFHILIDPWLRGSQSDVAAFFSQQRHAVDSAVQSIEEVERVICEVEALARSTSDEFFSSKASEDGTQSPIDAVLVSHEFTDHMHKETLVEVCPAVPVFATAKAADIISTWQHFETVVSMPSFTSQDPDWRHTIKSPLPPWLSISRIASEAKEMLYYHSAVMVAFSSSAVGNDEVEAVIYTPHGITVEDLRPLSVTEPPIHTLALLHGLHDIRLGRGAQLNLGAHNGLKAQRLTRAKYWVGTHDEVKRGGGLVSWFLRRDVLTVKDALEREMVEQIGDTGVNFTELSSGESLLLE